MITQRLHPENLSTSPFPHFAVRGAVCEELCRQLIADLPPWQVITKGQDPGNNLRFNYSAAEILRDAGMSAVWKSFVRRHTSQAFLDEIVSLFREHIVREGLQLGTADALRAGVRHLDDYDAADVLLDAQLGVNTPVTARSSVRGPHLDNPRKLFAGLLYLRAEHDDSSGGDLQLYRPSEPFTVDGQYGLAPESARVEKTVKYEQNSLVLFLNTPRSVHGVTRRSVTAHPRVFINFVGELRQPAFAVRRQRRRSWFGGLFQPSRRQHAA